MRDLMVTISLGINKTFSTKLEEIKMHSLQLLLIISLLCWIKWSQKLEILET